MNYKDLISSADIVKQTVSIPKRGFKSNNPDHHIWNNNGTWWINFTVQHRHQPTSERIRLSLETTNKIEARQRRDAIFEAVTCC